MKIGFSKYSNNLKLKENGIWFSKSEIKQIISTKQKLFLALDMFCMFSSSFLLIRRLHVCYPLIIKYAVATKERHTIIKKALVEFKGDTLKLKKLPPSSWLHGGELNKRSGPDPMNNIFLENYYSPKFALDIEN